MSFGTHGTSYLRQLRERKYTPNMRVAFDRFSHQWYFTLKKLAPTKKLTAQQIAQLRFNLEKAKRKRIKQQILALLLSVVVLGLLLWGASVFINWLQHLPAEAFH